MRKLALMVVMFTLVALALPSAAWGPNGHRIVGDIAMKYLSVQSKAAIKDLLGEQSLADAGNWADEIRKDSSYDWVKPLHYINVPRGATSVSMSRDCPDEKCVLGAIEHYTQVLRSASATHDEKVIALKLLVHFVADVHQPLHVSYADDRGGNQVKVVAFGEPNRNLHAVWDDTLIIHRMNAGRETMVDELTRRITATQLKQWKQSAKPIEWANESLAITRSLYAELPGRGETLTIDEAYYTKHIPQVENRLSAAGVRLANLLNSIFGEDKPATTRPISQKDRHTPATSQPTTQPQGDGL